MKKENFLIDGDYALDVEGRHLDLHNNFDFTGLKYLADENQVSLHWVKTNGDWVPKTEIDGFKITFNNLSIFKIQGHVVDNSSGNADLSFVGYLHPDDIELMDSCLGEQESTSSYHMIFVFENGFVIKVFADSAECKFN